MRIATGKVVDGKVVLDGERLDDGTVVTVLAPEADETFALSPDDEDALRAALAEADLGEGVDGDAFLDQLPR